VELTTAAIPDAVRAYLAAGLCALPADRAAKRPVVGLWNPYQKRMPTEVELSAWFANNPDAVCIVCGKISGNAEMMDFDYGGELFDPWCDRVNAAAPGLLDRLVIENTQSDGWHANYRCISAVCGSKALAKRRRDVTEDEITLNAEGERVVVLKGKEYVVHTDRQGTTFVIITLIETRGEGGLFLCDPTPGYELAQGDLTNLPVISEAERDILWQCGRELNEMAEKSAMSGDRSHNGDSLAHRSHNGRLSDDSGHRPGDDYNRRGDVQAVLAAHGWSYVRKDDINEHWRRPGKSKGQSATLRIEDRTLYVFSSNAYPFEMQESYRPFAVYAILEHDGDFSAATRALSEQGYGESPEEATGVDISAIVEMSAEIAGCSSHNAENGHCAADNAENGSDVPDNPNPGPIPEHLFQVPGLVSRVMDFTMANAPYPNVGLAFCGAIALQSYLCGRKVQTSTDLRPNIYLLALASSGTGKDYPRKVNSRVLFEIGHIAALGDKFASGQGIQDALLRSNAMLFQNDEMDGVLRQINFDRDNKHESIPNILLTLYTSANIHYPIRVKAGQKEMAHIDQPHLTLFGTATPQYFYESLSHRMLTNGFFARLIIVDIGKRGRGQLPGSVRNLPESILQTARWWGEFTPGRPMAGNLYNVHPDPRVVPFTPEAEQALTKLQRMGEDEWDKAHAANDEPAQTAWSRTCENATKMALLYACSENHEDPVIALPAVEWATTFAMHQTRRQLYLAATYVAMSEFDGLCKKATRYLVMCRDRGKAGDYPVPDWRLRRHLAINPTVYAHVTEALIKQRQAEFQTIPGKTKPRSGWALL